MTAKVLVVGGGLAGCGAAAAAAKAGATVTLLERADLLGISARSSGHIPHRYQPIYAEMRCLGSDEILHVFDECKIHDRIVFGYPEAQVWTQFDVTRVSELLGASLQRLGVEVRFLARVTDVVANGPKMRSVVLDSGYTFDAEAFVDATGGAGGVRECRQYGNGCVMCHYRCPSFGDRVSIVAQAGIKESRGRKRDGSIGPISPAYCLVKKSIAPALIEQIEREGFVTIPVPAGEDARARVHGVTASGVLTGPWAENVVLADIGGFVIRYGAAYTPLDELRRVPGLENAEYADPLSGELGNSVRYMAVSPRDSSLRVPGLHNLFVAGEKLGVNGLGEVVISGTIAGHNAARAAVGKEPFALPRTTIVGDFLAYVNERWDTEGLTERYSFFLGSYWKRLRERPGLNTGDEEVISQRIDKAGLTNVLGQVLA